jgi:DNA-binding NtrC family response regulator
VPLILEGETGTGKELMAKCIHESSERASRPFLVFDCATRHGDLLEASLFGQDGIGMAGASGSMPSAFELAEGGTLFIDEITELDLPLQAKLYRALERAEIQRLGGSKRVAINVRVVCATRRDIEAEIQAGRFRDDLYYRLAVARIQLPPLRDREGDVEFLARHFWAQLGGDEAEFPPELLPWLGSYTWPGNVRELRNAVDHRLAMGELADVHSILRPSQPPPPGPVGTNEQPSVDVVSRVVSEGLAFHDAREAVLRQFERQYVDAALERNGGNVTRAAATSGIARRYLYAIRSRSK